MSHEKHEHKANLLHPHRIDDRVRYQRAWVTNALVDAVPASKTRSAGVPDIGNVTGCNANTYDISANLGPNQVNSIISTTTEDNLVTLVAVTATEDGFINLQLMLIPTLVNDSVFI